MFLFVCLMAVILYSVSKATITDISVRFVFVELKCTREWEFPEFNTIKTNPTYSLMWRITILYMQINCKSPWSTGSPSVECNFALKWCHYNFFLLLFKTMSATCLPAKWHNTRNHTYLEEIRFQHLERCIFSKDNRVNIVYLFFFFKTQYFTTIIIVCPYVLLQNNETPFKEC